MYSNINSAGTKFVVVLLELDKNLIFVSALILTRNDKKKLDPDPNSQETPI
jgi:hypothetical protein